MRVGLTILSALIALGSLSSGFAIHENDPDLQHIVVSAPETYGQCVDAVTFDTLSVTNVVDPVTGDAWRLEGYVHVQYVVEGGGRVDVPGGFYAVNQVGDLELQISYPPVSEWPVFTNPSTGQPLSEIHVDVSISVIDQFGEFRGMLAIGPGHDWDVFCLTPPPPPAGEEGCTPGFWKNHLSAWSSTAYAPSQQVGSVFVLPSALSSLSQNSLLTALQGGGGPGQLGAAKILLRAAVAGLLNASHTSVDYPVTTSDLIAQVNSALASADRATMLELATSIDDQNNLGCPISR
jgi:hypothetical protein